MSGRRPPRPRVGSGARIDPGVRMGYAPDRPVADLALRIGPGARLRSGTVIYAGSVIGREFETGHGTVIREENEIGDGVKVWSHSTIDYACRIGHRVRLHANVYVAQFTVIEDDVFLGPGVVLLNDPHPGCAFFRQCMRGPTIKRGAVVGGGVVVLPMVTIGERAVVGAGAVVTKDVPPGTVVHGAPARVRGRRESLRCWTGHTLRPYR